jgi:hypothetical protein
MRVCVCIWAFSAIFVDKQESNSTMNPSTNVNTYELLDRQADFIHMILHTAFKLTKNTRRKYKLSVNAMLVINASYVYHKYIGTAFSLSSLYKLVTYYNRNRLRWQLEQLVSKGYINQCEIINGNKYYKISSIGVEIMKDFSGSYQSTLADFLTKQKIEL